MRIDVTAEAGLDACENLILLATAGEAPGAAGHELPAAVQVVFTHLRELGDFTGERGQAVVHVDAEGRRWALVGLGDGAALGPRAWRDAAAAGQKALGGLGAKSAHLLLPANADVGELTAGLVLSGYMYDRFISDEGGKAKRLETVSLVLPAGGDAKAVAAAAAKAEKVAAGTLAARDLLCAPGNRATPSFLAAEAKAIAADSSGRIRCRILGEDELAAEGFHALLAVGQGSAEESCLIELEYNPGAERTVVLVGKGVTFDAGGLSLKQPAKMDEMKYDMGGAATVLGFFRVLAALDLPLRVVGLVPSVENLPGGRAYKPGDVIVARSGLSIEIKNTDAEGRVILADALDYAKDFTPDLLIDLATLTGACAVALGHEAAGMMANEAGEPFQAALSASGERTGERVWPLPMYDEYAELIKSEFADMTNSSSSRYGGALAAAKLLQRFADHSPWIHLDIAGTAWTEKERGPVPKIGTGFGVRLLHDFLENIAWP